MPLIPSDPSSWSSNVHQEVFSCFVVASSTAVLYDWALTFGQESELIWRQRWSVMTVLYIAVRYIGIPYSVGNILLNLPGVLTTDMVSNIMNLVLSWTIFIINPMLNVFMITRLYAMYQRSRKMLIFLVATFVSITIVVGVIGTAGNNGISMDVFILRRTHQCVFKVNAGEQLRLIETYSLATVWEVLSLCLAIWIVVKYFRGLPPSSTGRTAGDYFMVLIKTHVLYFAFFAVSACFNLGLASPEVLDSSSVGAQIYRGVLELVTLLQMFVVGPRLILSIREYHAKLVANSEAGTDMETIALQERIRLRTISSDV
ncbi:uncharacterized protein EDB91DRAFT_1343100 [Suillus paluster]|uniref:uncharacterized protein n=1 Tax=Suillus paluster TaxID=48578 RepID=UPI001B882579|nr:uncharacterized protein EDB91DRAFT_1343100 [Suillus paluster]KAG1753711.1 hypothetical protein EDB91DRAFT_1343100 [Suillus paluster]